MKLKKIMALVLAGALGMSMLAGCGSSDSEEAATTTATDSSEDVAEDEDVFTGFEETVEIQAYGLDFFGDMDSDVMDAINEISIEAINVSCNYTKMDVATYMEQMGLMLAGGESFDLIMATAIPVVSFSVMSSQSELMDITEYLEYYAPEMLELMEDYIDATTLNGSVYAIPCYRIYNSDYYIIMRQDILDYLGLTEQAQNISSWSEFEEIMLAVKAAQDELPEELQTTAIIGNSDADGTIITNRYIDIASDDFASHYGFDVLGDTYKFIYTEDGVVSNYFASDDYRASLEIVAQWYEEGLVYKDAQTSSETGDTLMANGVVFAYTVQSEVGVEASKKSTTGYDVVCVKYCEVPIQTSNGDTWAWCVPVTSEEPEAAVAFLNLMYTNADIENLLVYGIEGRDYTLNDEGEACLVESPTYQSSDFFYGNQFLAYPQEGTGSDFRETSLASMLEATISPYYGVTIDTDPIANELTAISTVLDKYNPGLQSGTLDISYLDTMLSELEGAGINDVIAYYQECLDAWLAEQ